MHKLIIQKWPTYRALADDLGLSLNCIKSMAKRNRITDKYWPELIQAARKRKIPGVTYRKLAETPTRRRPPV